MGSTEEVFAVGNDNHLYQFVNSGSGWNWYDITYHNSGGTYWTVKGSPSVVWGSTVNVFVSHTNGELLQYSLPSGGSWFPYTLSSSGSTIGGAGATQVGTSLQVFANGASNHLLQFANSGSGWSQSDITYPGYVVQGGLSLVWGSYVNVFTIGSNSANGSLGNLLEYDLPPGGSWTPYILNSSTKMSGGTTSTLVGSTYEVFAD